MVTVLIINIDSGSDFDSNLHFRASLKKAGYKVYYADNLKNGIHKSRSVRPHIIIVFFEHSNFEIIEITKEIKLNPITRNPFLLLVTRQNDEFDKALLLELGADDYIVKPLEFYELYAKLKTYEKYITPDLTQYQS